MNDIDKKDINKRTENIQNGEVAIRNSHDEYLYFIANKSQKIVTALYLITGGLPDNEPLKSSIRQKSLELVEMTDKLGADAVFSKKDKICVQLTHIESLVSVGESAGYISQMNSEILKREIHRLYEHISESVDQQKENRNNILPEEFFFVPEQTRKEYPPEKMSFNAQAMLAGHESIKDIKDSREENAKEQVHSTAVQKSKTASLKPRKKSRRDFILNIIHKKKEVNIKDISSVFHGCSEKTIQRELTSLVNEGLVLKEGERRWSTYRLA